ncbi:MAG: aldo/keto reductase, partial [Desulfosarcina sp.]
RPLMDRLYALSLQSGHTPAQLALAWLLAGSPAVVPIPGMKRRGHLRENAAAADIRLSADAMHVLNGLDKLAAGERHNAQNLRFVEK